MLPNPKKALDQHYSKEEHIFYFICFLMGSFILIFCLFVFIYAPVKTKAKYGTVVDFHDYALDIKGNESIVHIQLDDGELVKVRKPKELNLSKKKIVILQEKTSILGGFKRYSFYEVKGEQPLKYVKYID